MPLAFALLLPLVFLHAEYQPSWSVGQTTLYLSDLAVLAIGGLGLASGLREGFGPLRPGRAVWAAAAAFLLVVFCSNVYGALREDTDLEYPLATLTAWSCAATTGALLQFLGVLNEFEGRRPGQREPSFLGIHDLAALSGATLSLGLLWLALGQRRRLGPVGGLAGGLGVVLSGATAAAAGVVAAGTTAWLLGRRRALAIAAVVAVVVAGVIGIRALDTRPLLDLLGVEHPRAVETNPEASWKQRLALAYIGGRIFLAHPLFGVGWQASEDEVSYGPYLDDARERFPDLAARAFPSPEHPWGVQNAYVQAAADMGGVGLAAFLALLLVPLRVAWRAGRLGGVPILWLLVTMGVWLGRFTPSAARTACSTSAAA